ncbi:hypothetical protein G6F63_016717 [Rhizopus arrhizus]|nr:hypothetical protein G6F63_016717 [Rhizopus arrhizus]
MHSPAGTRSLPPMILVSSARWTTPPGSAGRSIGTAAAGGRAAVPDRAAAHWTRPAPQRRAGALAGTFR